MLTCTCRSLQSCRSSWSSNVLLPVRSASLFKAVTNFLTFERLLMPEPSWERSKSRRPNSSEYVSVKLNAEEHEGWSSAFVKSFCHSVAWIITYQFFKNWGHKNVIIWGCIGSYHMYNTEISIKTHFRIILVYSTSLRRQLVCTMYSTIKCMRFKRLFCDPAAESDSPFLLATKVELRQLSAWSCRQTLCFFLLNKCIIRVFEVHFLKCILWALE